METAYVLDHLRSDDEHGNDAKLIGVYGSSAQAEAAVVRLRHVQGFRDDPDGFTIDSYRVGEDHWREGFDADAHIRPF